MTERAGYRGYIFSRQFLGERVPQHVQNLVIRDYAARHGLTYKLSATEYAMDGCYMMLAQVVKELPDLEGMICYSLFQLPQAAEKRRRVLDQVLAQGAVLHAALEGIVVRRREDIEIIEDFWRVRQTLPHCPSSRDIAASI